MHLGRRSVIHHDEQDLRAQMYVQTTYSNNSMALMFIREQSRQPAAAERSRENIQSSACPLCITIN